MPEKWEHLDLNGFEIKSKVKSNDIEIVFKFLGPFSKVQSSQSTPIPPKEGRISCADIKFSSFFMHIILSKTSVSQLLSVGCFYVLCYSIQYNFGTAT